MSHFRIYFNHLSSQKPYQSKQFQRLFHKLTDGRNVNVRFASQPRYLYYPAGYLFALRQPIVSRNKSILSAIEKKLTTLKDDSVKLERVRDGIIIKLSKNGKGIIEQIEMVDMSCTLFNLTKFVDMLREGGIEPKQKEYCLNVLDSSEAPAGNMTVYLGDISSSFLTFSVIVTEGTNLNMVEVQKTFRDSSI